MIPSLVDQVVQAAAHAASIRREVVQRGHQKGQSIHLRLEGCWEVGDRYNTSRAFRLLGYASTESGLHALKKLERRGYLVRKGMEATIGPNKAILWERVK